MKRLLSDLAEISLGTILTRVKAVSELQTSIPISTISMQELSYSCGKDDKVTSEIQSKVYADKLDKCLLVKEGDVVVGLSSQSAMVITKERANSLLLSNFCLVRIRDKEVLDPYYLVWLINENKDIMHQISAATQGQSYVKMISLDILRRLEIKLHPIQKQIAIGKIYDCSVKKKQCEKRLSELNYIILNKKLESVK